MGNLPIISQVKSLVQVIGGDADGARRTQENFSRQCPIISQVRSAVEAIDGDPEAAKKTQMEFVHGLSDFADGVPVVGQVKGVVHYAVGDTNGGDAAMKSSFRTSADIAGGAVGFVLAGPVGAVAGGVAGAIAMDVITTGVDSAVHKKYRPDGIIYQGTEVYNNPTDPGKLFDLVATPVCDGIAGAAFGDLAFEKVPSAQESIAMDKEIGKEGTKDVVESANNVRNQLKKKELQNDKQSTQTMVRDHTNDARHYGENRKSRLNKHIQSTANDTYKRQAERNFYMAEIKEPSELQQRGPLDLSENAYVHRGCAEHPAYDDYYRGREGALPSESTASTVRYLPKHKKIVAQKRCDNCLTYSHAMGNVPTDLVHNMTVPNEYVSKGQLAISAGKPVILEGGNVIAQNGNHHNKIRRN